MLTPCSSASDMNWTCLVYGGPLFIILIWWVVDAHKWFKGPKVNIEHLMLGRDGNIIDAEGHDILRGDGSEDDQVDPKTQIPDADAKPEFDT